jgi:hypothetical protein
MSVTIEYPFPENAPKGVQKATIEGPLTTTAEFTGFIPGRRYTLVISGYNGQTTLPQVQDNGEWGPALADGEATEFWNDEIVMPTNTLRILVTTPGTALHFSAQLISG